MNRALYGLFALLAPVATCLAQFPATQPASRPVSDSTILVLPIAPPAGSYAWVGKAIQQDVLVDLTQMTRARVLAPSTAPAPDADAALHAARDANANYVVFGSAQAAGTQLRVTGQVLDVESGQSLSTLKATAPADDLFPLEDALAVQIVRALPGATVPATQPAPSGVAAAPQPLPQIINEQPYVSEVTPAPQYEGVTGSGPYVYEPYIYSGYPYPYYYPYAGFFWGPGIIITGHHFHDFDHGFNHGFDHRTFVSPHVNSGLYSHGFAGHSGFRGSARFGTGGGFGGGHSFGGGSGGHAGGGGARPH
jgi:TolB-like protein